MTKKSAFSSVQRATIKALLWSALLGIAALAFDLATPLGVAGGIAYIPLILCSLWFTRPQTAFVFAVLATALTIVGFFLKPLTSVATWMAEVNRVLSIAALWLTAIVVYRHRRNKHKLQHAEEFMGQLAAIVKSSDDAIIGKDLSGIVTSWNDGATRTFGYTAQEMIGQSITRLIPRDRLPEEAKIISMISTGQKVDHFETRRVRKDGELIDISVTVSPIKDADGTVVGASKVARDITGQKKAAEDVHRSEALYRNLFENQLNGFAYCKLLFDDQGQAVDYEYVHVNHNYETLIGLSDLTGKKINDLIPGFRDSDPQYFDCIERVSLSGTPEKFETYFKPLGRWFAVSIYSPAKEYFVTLIDDISKRKRAEADIQQLNRELELRVSERTKELQDQTSKLQRLIDSSPDAIITADRQLIVTSWNSSAEQMYGYSALESMGKVLATVLKTDFINTTRDDIVNILDQKGYWRGEVMHYRKSGSKLWVLISAATIQDSQGAPAGIIFINRDITELKNHEAKLSALNLDLSKSVEQLSLVNKELEAFSYSVSHDLRSPLRGIDGWSQALLEDYGDTFDEQAHSYMNRVRSETQRMGQLIDDMIELSRVTRFELREQVVDLSSIVQTVAENLRDRDPERSVDFIIQKELKVQGDPHLLEAAINNLLGNAFKFTGKVLNARIEFGKTDQRELTTYFVRDNGAGFDMAFAGNLFGAFQRLHKTSEFPGTGVGLATVQRIIHRHRGRVWAESVPGQGATFFFTLQEAA